MSSMVHLSDAEQHAIVDAVHARLENVQPGTHLGEVFTEVADLDSAREFVVMGVDCIATTTGRSPFPGAVAVGLHDLTDEQLVALENTLILSVAYGMALGASIAGETYGQGDDWETLLSDLADDDALDWFAEDDDDD